MVAGTAMLFAQYAVVVAVCNSQMASVAVIDVAAAAVPSFAVLRAEKRSAAVAAAAFSPFPYESVAEH